MSIFELFVLSTALGADLFSVAVPIGMIKVRKGVILTAAAVFAIFHVGMILAGYHAGHWLEAMVDRIGVYHIELPPATVERWTAAAGGLILAGLGVGMLFDFWRGGSGGGTARHPLEGTSLIFLAVSVSLDALAAGFSLGMMDVDLIRMCTILGAVIFSISIAGLGLGRKIGNAVGVRAGIFGGAVLLALGIHVFWTAFWT